MMGDYTRYSSQPATADLVRGDLGEFWSTNGPGAESPRRSPSLSAVSDALDLESLATPRPHPSKAMRKDPLPGLLADILGSDISSDELAPEAESPCHVEQTPSPTGPPPGSTKQPRANNKRTRAKPQPKPVDSPQESPVSSPSRQSPPAGRAGPSSTKRPRPTRPPTQAKSRTKTTAQAPTRRKRKARKNDEDIFELSDATDTEPESPPKKRRAKQPSSKEPRPHPAQKPQLGNEGATGGDLATSQAKRKPTRVAKKPVGRGSVPQKTKAGVESTSPATSESSDKEELDARPVEERKEGTSHGVAKPGSMEQLPVAHPALSIRGEAGPHRAAPTLPLKPLPATSRELEPAIPAVPKGASSPAPPQRLPTASMEVKHVLPVAQQGATATEPSPLASRVAERVLPRVHKGESSTASPKPSPVASGETEPVLGVAQGNVVAATPPKPLPPASREAETVLPVAPKAEEIIILSSESDDDCFPPAGSTSPLFVERGGPHIASGSPERTVVVKPAISPDHGWEPRLPTSNTRIAPPASSRSHTFPKHTTRLQRHDLVPTLPAGIRDAFLSDEQPVAAPPSPSPEAEVCPDEGVSPGDVWEEVVDDGSLPAVLHKIVTRLHRSMKPREEVVRDIAAEYQENALRLLNNLRVRHDQEKTNTLAALWKASRAASSVFSDAGRDMADLIHSLQEMDVAHTADALTRPILTLKLESVSQLCQERLESYTDGERGLDVATDPEDSLDGLAHTYRTKLFNAVGRLDDVAEGPNEVNAPVDDFITRCLSGDTAEIRPTAIKKKPLKSAQNADDALEVLLDGIMNTFQESKMGGASAQPDLNNMVDAEEDLEMADIDLLGYDSGLHALFSHGKGLAMA